MRFKVHYNRFLDRPYYVDKFDNINSQTIVSGCDHCQECCGLFHQPLMLLPSQNPDLFYTVEGIPSIHPVRGCLQRDKHYGPCKLQPIEKPVLCNIYPFRLIEKRLQVHYVCPAVQNTTVFRLQSIGIQVAEYLVSLPHDFLFEISEPTPQIPQMIDLNIQIIIPGTENASMLADI